MMFLDDIYCKFFFKTNFFFRMIFFWGIMIFYFGGVAAGGDEKEKKKYRLDFSIIDEDGKELSDASVSLQEDWKSKKLKQKTDSNGACGFSLKPETDEVYVRIKCDGYVAKTFHWYNRLNNPEKFSRLYVTLNRGKLIGGTVTDDKGKPLSNVSLNIDLRFKKDDFMCGDNFNLERRYFGDSNIKTDKNGQWRIRTFPGNLIYVNFVSISHEYYIPHQRYLSGAVEDRKSLLTMTRMLYNIKLQKGNV